MVFIKQLDGWLVKMLWHKSDTPETLDHKVYLVRNGIIASMIITTLVFFPLIISGNFKILLISSPLVVAIVFTDGLLMIIKRGINWFMYFYYGGYIILCTSIIIVFGGLPNSCGAWGGAFIVFMHALAIKNKRLLVINAILYLTGLVAIVLAYPYLTPPEQWTPELNNMLFTIDEIWMCLFLVKSFYDSVVARTNQAKRKAEHLHELDQLKSKMYANITHEFRTPLTLIRGNAGEISEHQDGEIREKAKCIIQGSDKILFLVNQMLNLSKVEEGNVPLHYLQTDLVAFVKFVTGEFQGYAEMRKIHLHFESQVERLVMDVEKEMLEGSLSNLLSNAIKYTPGGGEVIVSLRMLTLPETSDHQVEISVRDTGIGIPADKLDKIFIRFYRVEDLQFPCQEGTGIGLTLVSEYLKLMRGSVRVISSPGKGSEFVLTLPVTHNAEAEEIIYQSGNTFHKVEESKDDSRTIECFSGRPRLLIIEDNPELREYLYRLLGNEYHIFIADNGIQGIEKARENIPDIVLSDVMMPGKDGYQVCQELKNDFRTSHIPVILLTARADTQSRITGLELGADAYLTKPFNKRELQICLHNLLIQREMLRLKYSSMLERTTDGQDHGLNGQFLGKVIFHLEKNYQNDWYGIHQLYADLGISRVQLHRKLKALTGLSASNYIRAFRLQKAKKLLLETSKSISDIAFEAGFSDANYFSKAFIQEFGLPASEMRKSYH